MAEILTVVTWKWQARPGYRSTFTSEHVNVLARMVARNYAQPHRIVCVTDDADGISDAVGIIPLWDTFGDIPSPHGGLNPSCYRRLKMFGPEAQALFGDRFVSMDLDCVVTGDLTPIFDRPEDFVMWGDTNHTTFYNGSLILMSAGARPRVWNDFDPVQSPMRSRELGQFGSDQGWIGACLGPGEAKFSKADGVYSYRLDCKPIYGRLPPGARLIFFHGNVDPWSPEAQGCGWVRDHWR